MMTLKILMWGAATILLNVAILYLLIRIAQLIIKRLVGKPKTDFKMPMVENYPLPPEICEEKVYIDNGTADLKIEDDGKVDINVDPTPFIIKKEPKKALKKKKKVIKKKTKSKGKKK